jgi:hypothetical protein
MVAGPGRAGPAETIARQIKKRVSARSSTLDRKNGNGLTMAMGNVKSLTERAINIIYFG